MRELLRKWWDKLNQPIRTECSISYCGNPEDEQETAPGAVVTVMRLHYTGIAVARKESALVRVIHPFADAQQKHSDPKKERCSIVCDLDLKNYAAYDHRCPHCGKSFIPGFDFKVLKGVLHITSFKDIPVDKVI